MRLIEAALTDPDASGIVISGSAGVGKSRVAREALHAAASRGCEVRWVVGTSCGRGLPLGALASWAGLVGSDSLQLVCEVIDSLTAALSAGRSWSVSMTRICSMICRCSFWIRLFSEVSGRLC